MKMTKHDRIPFSLWQLVVVVLIVITDRVVDVVVPQELMDIIIVVQVVVRIKVKEVAQLERVQKHCARVTTPDDSFGLGIRHYDSKQLILIVRIFAWP